MWTNGAGAVTPRPRSKRTGDCPMHLIALYTTDHVFIKWSRHDP